MSTQHTPHYDLVLDKGCNFMQSFNWYGAGKFLGQIEDIFVGYPTRVKVSDHGLPQETPTPVFIEGLSGDVEVLNTSRSGLMEAEYFDADWFTINVDTVGKEWNNNSGSFMYLRPSDLSGWTVEMIIKKKWHDTDNIAVLSTVTGEITLGSDDGGIVINVPFTETENWNFSKAVWFLEATLNDTKIRCAKGTLVHAQDEPD